MSRRAVAVRLSLIVAVAGLLPIAGVGAVGIQLLRQRSEHAALVALEEIATQAAARTHGYVHQQHQLLRAVAAVASGPDAERRLEESVLEAPSLGKVTLIDAARAAAAPPAGLSPAQLADALAGKDVSSPLFLAEDTTPAQTRCVPARGLPGRAVCAQLDLLELWRFVQRIKAGETGYALVFDQQGHLLASGAGSARAAILTGELISSAAQIPHVLAKDRVPEARYTGATGAPVLAAWALLPEEGWLVAVEQPEAEALGPARTAQWWLLGVLALALLASVAVGAQQSSRVMAALALEERWKTAGRIAAGITHDLGHRLRTLQTTSHLADTGNPAFFPQIKANLASEVGALQKFVADFSQLSRDVQKLERFPLEVGALLESIKALAEPHAAGAQVSLELARPAAPLWISADRYLLERALLNLVANAIEASPKGAAVQLGAAAVEGAAQLFVKDRGHGIEPERLERLFDAFVSTRRTGSHLGMGLANVKRIADAHAARLEVQSAVGQGSTFRLTLAAAAAPGAGQTSSGPGASMPPASP